MQIFFAESSFQKQWNLQLKTQLEAVIRLAHSEVAEQLPYLSPRINFLVQPNPHECISDTGENGFSRNSRAGGD